MTSTKYKFQGSRDRLRAPLCLYVNAAHSIIYVHYFWAMEQSSSQYFSCTSSLFSKGKGKKQETGTFTSKIFASIKWIHINWKIIIKKKKYIKLLIDVLHVSSFLEAATAVTEFLPDFPSEPPARRNAKIQWC